MASLFPGMNPFLEQESLWPDFHQSFLPAVREALNSQVRPNYSVRIEERLFIREVAHDDARFLGRANVAIRDQGHFAESAAAKAVIEAPAYGRWLPRVETERQGFLEVRSREDDALVTVMELLSPSNKRPGADREQYLSKRLEIFASTTHLVEIDLLRSRPRLPIDDLPECDYYAAVSRVEDRPQIGIWPIRLRDRLPVIPIPLRSPDSDAKLDLQEVLDRVYDAAGYEDYIYTGRPQPPLQPEDEKWAVGLILKSN